MTLKMIPKVNYDFDDVIENIEKLIGHYFPNAAAEIRSDVKKLSDKYSSQINGDYDEFLRLAEKTKVFDRWHRKSIRLTRSMPDVAGSILDLYFQIQMVPNYDVYGSTHIFAYLEDIQPYLKHFE